MSTRGKCGKLASDDNKNKNTLYISYTYSSQAVAYSLAKNLPLATHVYGFFDVYVRKTLHAFGKCKRLARVLATNSAGQFQ